MLPSQEIMHPSLAQVDRLIRSAEQGTARTLLSEILLQPLPRSQSSIAARLARRLRLPHLGIRLLHRYVRPSDRYALRRNGPALLEEQLEYAACLIRLGAVAEGALLLENVDPEQCPAVYLQRAFARICEWDYEGSIAPLRKFLQHASPNDYEYRVGLVNLAAALVVSQTFGESTRLLTQLRNQFAKEQQPLLLANVLELTAQNFFLREQWSAALEILDRATEILPGGDSLDAFFIRKWRTLTFLRSEGPNAKTLKLVDQLKLEAARMNHWESVRYIDYELGIATADEKLLSHVYFGTRYPAWRQRILNAWKKHSVAAFPPKTFTREMGQGAKQISLNESTGTLQNGANALAGGRVPHRLFRALNADFYRPMRTAEIFTTVFPGDHFSPETSANRVYQGIRRLNSVLEANKIALTVEHDQGAYHFAIKDEWKVQICCELQEAGEAKELVHLPPQVNAALRKFRSSWPRSEFSAHEFLTKTQTPRRTGLRYLTQAVTTGRLDRLGSGPSTRYKFLSESS